MREPVSRQGSKFELCSKIDRKTTGRDSYVEFRRFLVTSTSTARLWNSVYACFSYAPSEGTITLQITQSYEFHLFFLQKCSYDTLSSLYPT